MNLAARLTTLGSLVLLVATTGCAVEEGEAAAETIATADSDISSRRLEYSCAPPTSFWAPRAFTVDVPSNARPFTSQVGLDFRKKSPKKHHSFTFTFLPATVDPETNRWKDPARGYVTDKDGVVTECTDKPIILPTGTNPYATCQGADPYGTRSPCQAGPVGHSY